MSSYGISSNLCPACSFEKILSTDIEPQTYGQRLAWSCLGCVGHLGCQSSLQNERLLDSILIDPAHLVRSYKILCEPLVLILEDSKLARIILPYVLCFGSRVALDVFSWRLSISSQYVVMWHGLGILQLPDSKDWRVTGVQKLEDVCPYS